MAVVTCFGVVFIGNCFSFDDDDIVDVDGVDGFVYGIGRMKMCFFDPIKHNRKYPRICGVNDDVSAEGMIECGCWTDMFTTLVIRPISISCQIVVV